MRRWAAALTALVAFFAVLSPVPAAADGGIGQGVDIACEVSSGAVGAIADVIAGEDLCDQLGDATEKKLKQEWKAVWDSVIGDAIKSARDVAKYAIKKTLTVALSGPSLDLEATGLFGEDAKLAGMLVWLGLVIATFGLMWQLGKMALTGQLKYAGQAAVGWVQNVLLSGVGVGFVALLSALGDAFTDGIVAEAFGDDGKAYERIVAVLIPQMSNPMVMLGVVGLLVCVGLAQMVLVFLRQSAIPIQCLLLPIAGAGRVGGDATRQWAPRLITSILVVIAYKPILAIIICTGFSEFGHSGTLAEWLRGVATLVLGILAPVPLTKVFAPIGAEVGAGMAAGGASGAVSAIGSQIGHKGRSGGSSGSDDGGDASPPTAVEYAQHVEKTMPSQRQQETGGDALGHAARNEPAGAEAAASAGGAGAESGAAAGGAKAAGAGPAAVGIHVLDGLHDGVQRGANEFGGNK